MNVEPSTFARLSAADTFWDLVIEYEQESSVEGMPPANVQVDRYRQLEDIGALYTFSAIEDGRVVGFITMLAPVLPHYGVTTAVAESFFVAKAHRHTLAGLKLLHAAESKAAELGACGFFASAPYEGKLFHLLPKLGYRETNRTFFKKLEGRKDG